MPLGKIRRFAALADDDHVGARLELLHRLDQVAVAQARTDVGNAVFGGLVVGRAR